LDTHTLLRTHLRRLVVLREMFSWMQLKGIIQASYVLGRNCGVLIANDDQNKISLIASLEGYSGAFSFCGTRKTFLPI